MGDRFTTYNGLPVEMIELNPNGGNPDYGYYTIVREIGGLGKKTDVSAQNQIDKLYFNQHSLDSFASSCEVEVGVYIEGAVKQVLANQYERDPKARRACIDHFGALCQICGFNFSKTYDAYGEGFIEVHHIKPLNKIKSSYVVDPLKDLIPVCSNCHSIFHRGKDSLSVSEMQVIFSKDT